MSTAVEVLLALIGLVIIGLLARVLVTVRRPGTPSRPPASSSASDAEAPTRLDPLSPPTSDASHSGAATLQHRCPPVGATESAAPPPEPVPAADTASPVPAAGDVRRREERLENREHRLERQVQDLDRRADAIARSEREIDAKTTELDRLTAAAREALEQAAELTAEQARNELIGEIETEAKRTAALHVRDIEQAARDEGEERARRILTTAIQRVASEQTAETVMSTVDLPGEDMKGRIIGREGRNIRTFEHITGVNVVVDETPEAVTLSCFDPVRREVARRTLSALVEDGRIHPRRIEDTFIRCQGEVERMCRRAAEDALAEVGIVDLHPDLVAKVGLLRYRTSYGQNVLAHLVESAHLAGLLADELGLDRALCVRCAFLHDIGKACTHESEGSHALVGAELARKAGECEDVVHAIEAHHNEVEPRTVEAVLTQAADAISGSRPGARRESAGSFAKRMRTLEKIAGSCEGVEKVYAMQAGHEVRVMVLPDQVDDIGAQVLARDIAKQIEHDLTYPGQIQVTVVRESRATEIAR